MNVPDSCGVGTVAHSARRTPNAGSSSPSVNCQYLPASLAQARRQYTTQKKSAHLNNLRLPPPASKSGTSTPQPASPPQHYHSTSPRYVHYPIAQPHRPPSSAPHPQNHHLASSAQPHSPHPALWLSPPRAPLSTPPSIAMSTPVPGAQRVPYTNGYVAGGKAGRGGKPHTPQAPNTMPISGRRAVEPRDSREAGQESVSANQSPGPLLGH
ncbi:hypothetical protein EJ06DRAFT_276555 [Trichodelitschia bisporula]|uniref:Uncharacterized protein n=1 Tax=Trichodelitschia bisporula TaxID=703511 RepID=A0A6G1I5K5_9PEZI|nr:hypothetical protein EJ06DRAFT_276555 [Trichodelitschia bisporula]